MTAMHPPDPLEHERSFSNGVHEPVRLTIAVPTYRDDARPLIARLSRLDGASECALILFDDGSCMDTLIEAHGQAIHAYPGPARLVASSANAGRSAARNRLLAMCETEWVLFLDADMLPDTDAFLRTYITAASGASQPSLVAGGFTIQQIKPGEDQRLHYGHAQHSDCINAAERMKAPGRFVYSSNILVHRAVLNDVGFDETFQGWGWEDVDWGLRVAAAHPVHHIDNTATHLGLEADSVLVRKFGDSGENFARLVRKHPDAAASMPLFRAARAMRPVQFLAPVAKSAALLRALPVPLRLAALKLYRAAMYARYL